MGLPAATHQAIMRSEAKGASETATRLSGRWLILARVAWFVLVAVTMSIFVISLPTYIAHLYMVDRRPPGFAIGLSS